MPLILALAFVIDTIVAILITINYYSYCQLIGDAAREVDALDVAFKFDVMGGRKNAHASIPYINSYISYYFQIIIIH